MFAIVGFAIFSTQYLQSVLGMRPFTAALWSLVPMAGTMTAGPRVHRRGRFHDRRRRVRRAHPAARALAALAHPDRFHCLRGRDRRGHGDQQ
jgi:DHA2 family multidrug resistance protein-like MFS transporter